MPCQKKTFGHSRCARPISTSDATIRAEGKGAAGIGTRIWHRGRAPAAQGGIDLAGEVLFLQPCRVTSPLAGRIPSFPLLKASSESFAATKRRSRLD
jgi:hypothetical protein